MKTDYVFGYNSRNIQAAKVIRFTVVVQVLKSSFKTRPSALYCTMYCGYKFNATSVLFLC